jgi:CRP/FNR family transcriptional regulator, cyclic AMP receptor protein
MILPEEMECVEFLQNLGAPHANQIALAAQLRECPAGTVLFREGQKSPFIYFVLRGAVSLEIEGDAHQPVQVQTVGPGELLGWSAVLGLNPMTATTRAVGPCRLAALAVDKLLALWEHDPRLGMAFMRQLAITLADRLRTTRHRLSGEPHHGRQPRAAGKGCP